MRKLLVAFCLLCFAFSSHAQITDAEKKARNRQVDTIQGWKKGATFMLNFSQVSLTNWNAGGLNSLSLNGTANMFANLTKGKAQWENSLDLGYGILRQGRKDNVAWLKTDDRIEINSLLGKKAKGYCKSIKPLFDNIRYHCDKLELMIDDELWPLTKYRELLFTK